MLQFSEVVTLFNSPFFAGLATLIAGGGVLIVFKLDQRSKKMKSARVLINEIRNAEEAIGIIAEKINSGSPNDLPSVLPTNNWATLAHLFVTDLDSDELKLLNNFYTSCAIVHDAATRNNNFFWVTTEERARVVQQIIGSLAEAGKKQEEIEPVLQVIMTYPQSYTPQKTLDLMKFHIQNFSRITTTSCGVKLKKIAKIKA